MVTEDLVVFVSSQSQKQKDVKENETENYLKNQWLESFPN